MLRAPTILTVTCIFVSSCLCAAPIPPANTTPLPPGLTPEQQVMHAWCDPVTRAIPRIKLKPCMAAGLEPVDTKSVLGRPIMMRDVVAKTDTAAARVMIIGGIHGDELTAPAIVFRWLEWIDQREAQPYHWQVIPVLNPDGLLAKPPTRTNANGIDLNRNFPTPNWDSEAPAYWAKKTKNDPRRFPGKKAVSEPESQWLDQQMERFKPDAIISIHAPYGVLDFDGDIHPPQKLGRLLLNPVGTYPGSLGNYSGNHQGVPVVTIELSHALDLGGEEELKNIWRDMIVWLNKNVAKPPILAAPQPGAIGK